MSDPHGNEEWRPVVGYEGFYSISNHGRVRRDAMATGATCGRILKPGNHTGGYLNVNLSKHNSTRSYLVHRLVVFAFISVIEKGMETNHKDFDKTNNHLSNLEIVTPSENQQHLVRAGRRIVKPNPLFGEAHQNSKLTEAQVREIRSLRQSTGMKQRDIGKLYGVSQTCIGKICSGKHWPHIH